MISLALHLEIFNFPPLEFPSGIIVLLVEANMVTARSLATVQNKKQP